MRAILVISALVAFAGCDDGGSVQPDVDATLGGAGGEGGAGGGVGGEGGGAGGQGGAGGAGGQGGAGGEGAAGGEGEGGGGGQGGAAPDMGMGGEGGGRPPRDMGVPDQGVDPDGTVPDAMVVPDADVVPDAAVVPDAEVVIDAMVVPDMAPPPPPTRMSFFVTSLDAMRALSGSQDGFGGDLGGLEGADQICQLIGIRVGEGHKTWRAFLSVTQGPDGQPVHAIDRIGDGPWYDANDRLVAMNRDGLLNERPDGDAQSVSDLPDELGVPLTEYGNAHDVLTGSDRNGRVAGANGNFTCNDWTSSDGRVGGRQTTIGHSYPRSPRSGRHWISDHTIRGCSPGVNLIQNGAGEGDCVGCSGGYGGIYCFAVRELE